MTASQFKDHFSGHSATYQNARPSYPASMYKWLRAQIPHAGPIRAWDCATGNGQVARDLIQHADHVVATDASPQQIECALPQVNIDYRVASAEQSGLEPESVHWITVGQALHWFDTARFYEEASRVLVPGGLLSMWTYRQVHITRAVDELIGELYEDVLGPYWPVERFWVEQGYKGLLPAWQSLATPQFETACDWTAEQLAAYLSSWSATQRYRRQTGEDPVAKMFDALRERYGAGQRRVRWALVLHAFRRPSPASLATL
ncbi:MAG: class I SAM-dependent methyltransferase [Pseudomonadota bacterium]